MGRCQICREEKEGTKLHKNIKKTLLHKRIFLHRLNFILVFIILII